MNGPSGRSATACVIWELGIQLVADKVVWSGGESGKGGKGGIGDAERWEAVESSPPGKSTVAHHFSDEHVVLPIFLAVQNWGEGRWWR